MRISFDLGFGWTKVCSSQGQCFKFPSRISYHAEAPVDNVEKVLVDGKYYTVGEDAKYEGRRITLAGIEELVKYFPAFKKYALEKLEVEDEKKVEIVTGLPPIYKDYAKILEEQGAVVLPQGVGIFLDVKDKVDTSEMLIIDIGYNTVDYLITKGEIKKKGNTFVKQGIEELVKRFQEVLPKEFSHLKSRPSHRVMEVFERGYSLIDGEKVDLSSYKEKAIEDYIEILSSMLKNEIGDFIEEAETVVIAGGGAYYLKNIRPHGVYVPSEPEFSQARGYLKA